MSRFLSQKYIDEVELFIENNQPSKNLPAISYSFRDQTIEEWNNINNSETPVTTYFQFLLVREWV